MNLVIDSGNSRIKAAVFENTLLKEKHTFADEHELMPFLDGKSFENSLVSSVTLPAERLLDAIRASGVKINLTHATPLPLRNLYSTPQTLGVDRIAGACGALDIFPNQNCLVIDVGTCINYEFVDASSAYHGGAISPGVNIRFEAMHKFTRRLPLVQNNPSAPLIGDSTETCMQSGVMNGMLGEIKGMIELYKLKYPGLGVILCGGDSYLFENQLKPLIFVAPELVLSGLNRILLHNVRN